MLLESLWKFNCDEPVLGIELLDLSQNMQINFIAYSKKGNLIFLSSDGQLKLKQEICTENPIWTIKLFDFDNDGNIEIAVGGMDGILRVYKIPDLYELNHYWSHKFSSSISGILTNDINKNGQSEIIVYSLDKTLRVLNPVNGKLIWGQVFQDGIEDAVILESSESKIEQILIACGNDGTVRAFSLKNGDLIWFKSFSDKIRFVDYIKSKNDTIIVCGGDDKELHFISKESKEEIKSFKFDDYVWKCLSFPNPQKKSILVSTYSFEYLNHSKKLQHIQFTSKLVHINKDLEIIWELKNKNIEVIKRFQMHSRNFIAIGTTQGELIILDELSGNMRYNIKQDSCVNAIQYEKLANLLIICYENGTIDAYHIDIN